jgi:predicted DNA-binding transcriptional regulator AlpA
MAGKLLSKAEVARILGLAPKSVTRFICRKTDPLPCVRLSARLVRVPEDLLYAWIERHMSAGIGQEPAVDGARRGRPRRAAV